MPGQLTSRGSRKILQFSDRHENCDIDASVSHPLRHWLLRPTVLRTLEVYDRNNAVKTSIENEIRCIEAANRQRNLLINFYSLESHRSTSSFYGQSFLQKYRLLYIHFQQVLKTEAALQVAASTFLDNPMLLREDPDALLQCFSC